MKTILIPYLDGEKLSIVIQEKSKTHPSAQVPNQTFVVPDNFIWELPEKFLEGKKPTRITNLAAAGFLKQIPLVDANFKVNTVCPNINYATAKNAVPSKLNPFWVILGKAAGKSDLLLVITNPMSAESFLESYQYQEKRMWHWYYTTQTQLPNLIAYIYNALIETNQFEHQTLFHFDTTSSLLSHETPPVVSYESTVHSISHIPLTLAEIVVEYMAPQPVKIHTIDNPAEISYNPTFFSDKPVYVVNKTVPKAKESLYKSCIIPNKFSLFEEKLNDQDADIVTLLINTIAEIELIKNEKVKVKTMAKCKSFIEEYAKKHSEVFWKTDGIQQITGTLQISIPITERTETIAQEFDVKMILGS